jgi:serine/threonine-protein kinase
MSPEQAAADPGIDGRSDLYSLACVLYELLTGEPPFTGATLEAVLVQRFTRPAPRVGRKRSGIPPELDAAIYKAMARAPNDRFASMTGFREALVRPPSPAAATAGKSIAVLPFTNMSADPENEYFSDGIAEEVINALTQVPDLKVAARTSSFSFKGKPADLRTIGDALGVETILEGSVRKAGNRVRIAVQLTNVADGYHLWAERYDRELTDIFAIQDEIATAIALRLQATLSPAADAPLVRPATPNVDAYDLFLKARRLLRARGRAMLEAITCFERAIELDPEYAAAHAGLAHALVLSSFWGMMRPADAADRARRSARTARELEPSLLDAVTSTALVEFCVNYDRAAARAAWDRARELERGNVDARALRAAFDLCYAQGDLAGAIAELRAAAPEDPLSAYPVAQLAVILAWAGELGEALAQGRRAVELDPDSSFSRWALLHALAFAGDTAGVRVALDETIARLGRHPWFLMMLAVADRASAERLDAGAVCDELTARARLDYVQSAVLGTVALAAGRSEDAIRWFDRAATERDPLFISIAAYWPAIDAARRLPGWRGVMERIEGPGRSGSL